VSTEKPISTRSGCDRPFEWQEIRHVNTAVADTKELENKCSPMLVMNLRQHLTTVTRKAACWEEGRSVSYLYDFPLMTNVNSKGCEKSHYELVAKKRTTNRKKHNSRAVFLDTFSVVQKGHLCHLSKTSKKRISEAKNTNDIPLKLQPASDLPNSKSFRSRKYHSRSVSPCVVSIYHL